MSPSEKLGAPKNSWISYLSVFHLEEVEKNFEAENFSPNWFREMEGSAFSFFFLSFIQPRFKLENLISANSFYSGKRNVPPLRYQFQIYRQSFFFFYFFVEISLRSENVLLFQPRSMLSTVSR